MLRTSVKNALVNRSLKPLYETGVAWACELDYDGTLEIVPGTPMFRKKGTEKVTPVPADGDYFGLSALFAAPKFGIDETKDTNEFAVYVGGNADLFKATAQVLALDEAEWATTKKVYAGADAKLHAKGTVVVGTLVENHVAEGWITLTLDTVVAA